MKHVYLMIFDLDVEKGGKTSAMLTRAKYFNDANIKTDIVTFDYKTNYQQIIDKLVEIKKLSKESHVYNQFHFFENESVEMGKNETNINKKYQTIIDNSFSNEISKTNVELFSKESGELIGKIKYKNDEENYTLDIFLNGSKVKRVYCVENWIRRIKEYNSNGKVYSEVFFNRNGNPFIRRNINVSTGKLEQIYLLYKNKCFKNNIELGKYFVDNLVEDTEENILICDGTGSVEKIIDTNKLKKVQKYAVMHTTHVTPKGDIKPKEDTVLKSASKLDGVVFLNNDYINDVKDEYDIKNAYQINNFVQDIPEHYSMPSNKVVGCISRLSEEKGFDKFISVAKKVVSHDNQIEFHIYGEGEYKEEINKMIKENNVEKYVKLFGYTTDPIGKLDEFKCVLTTSQTEVQSLSMIEAMFKGKPVIAFDIKYGPSQFIKNNFNGYLIENNDEENMVKAILEIVNDENKAIRYGENGRELVLDEFNPYNIIGKWNSLFDEKISEAKM
ncbi:glycosyltransferase [Mammaliicoccus sciuri]|uniref:glycosyltransferase n=1 Tax=Mammaliicoccus sciuri TaxID=1296 RepID=UPI001EF41C0E|nr:glycosyltransferase [Mammaliicoccus sciuri]